MFKNGRPTDEMISLLNQLPPAELVEAMSDAREAHARGIQKRDPTQKKFKGWFRRIEERRQLARRYVPPPGWNPTAGVMARGSYALYYARKVSAKGESATHQERYAARNGLWEVVSEIERQQVAGELGEELGQRLANLKGELLREVKGLLGPPSGPRASVTERGSIALDFSRQVRAKGELASPMERSAARNGLWEIVSEIERQEADGDKGAEKIMGELLKEIARLMDSGT